MQPNKVVIRLKDGTVARGQTNDFFPNKARFHLTTLEGNVEEFDIEELKAVFFVKDCQGDESYEYRYSDEIPGGGRKIKVDFADGEEMIGYTQGYSPDRPGFFLIPADSKGNNEKVFVVKSATKKIQFL
ncbi:MAG: hypothetical protein JRF69_08895 [Deltaproteobacteria bacterium]|nr:hypothetical protein [Deltaproteobacteria bacterium]